MPDSSRRENARLVPVSVRRGAPDVEPRPAEPIPGRDCQTGQVPCVRGAGSSEAWIPNWLRANELFQAIERAHSHRQAFLTAACGPDRALRKFVERPVRAHERAKTFLNDPAILADGFDRAGMKLHAAVARRRFGELTGDQRGREYCSQSDAWMSKRRHRQPDPDDAADRSRIRRSA